MVAYLLLARITDILVGIEEGADVDGLAAPDGSLDSPVQGQLQGAPVERPVTTMSVRVSWCLIVMVMTMVEVCGEVELRQDDVAGNSRHSGGRHGVFGSSIEASLSRSRIV
jgi:hypothetical protein